MPPRNRRMAPPTAAPFGRYGAGVVVFKLGDSNGRGAQNRSTGTNGSRVNPWAGMYLNANRACTADGTS